MNKKINYIKNLIREEIIRVLNEDTQLMEVSDERHEWAQRMFKKTYDALTRTERDEISTILKNIRKREKLAQSMFKKTYNILNDEEKEQIGTILMRPAVDPKIEFSKLTNIQKDDYFKEVIEKLQYKLDSGQDYKVRDDLKKIKDAYINFLFKKNK